MISICIFVVDIIRYRYRKNPSGILFIILGGFIFRLPFLVKTLQIFCNWSRDVQMWSNSDAIDPHTRYHTPSVHTPVELNPISVDAALSNAGACLYVNMRLSFAADEHNKLAPHTSGPTILSCRTLSTLN